MNPDNNLRGQDMSFFDYLNIVKKKRRLIFVVVFTLTFISVVISLISQKTYRSEAVIMPLSGGGGGLSGMSSQFGGIPFLGAMMPGVTTQTQQFMALLGTRTLAENLVKKYDLVTVFNGQASGKEIKQPSEQLKFAHAVDSLKGSVQFSENTKNATISIAAEHSDPVIAAEIANYYVEGLQELINQNSFTAAKRNRIFIEEQLSVNKRELLQIGRALNEFYKEGHVSNVESRVDVSLDVGDEFGYLADGNSVSDNNAPYDNIWSMVKKGAIEVRGDGDGNNVLKDVPQQVYLQYLTLRRELLGKMNGLLSQQFEMAKIEENKEDLAFQVIDRARTPEFRYKPNRKKIVVGTFMASFFISLFLAFFVDRIEKHRQYHKGVNEC